MSGKLFFLSAIMIIVVAAYVLWGFMSSQAEHPKYKVIAQHNDIEIRAYAPQLIAQVTVDGDRKEAISKGFRMLADYIFGNNDASDKIQMTAPVSQKQSTQIAMTAPVQQQQSDKQWVVEFIMPSNYTLKTLPKPNSDKITIIERDGYQSVAIRFSGSGSEENLDKHLTLLNEYINKNKISVKNIPIYAFYNPPWTLPIFRRNEIHYRIISNENKTIN